MTFTFKDDLSDRISRLRILIGDTNPDRQGLQDETILAEAEKHDNDDLTAAHCRDLLLAKWQARVELNRVKDLGDSSQEFDLQFGAAAWNKETAKIRRRGLRLAGVKPVRVIGTDTDY